MTPVRAAFRAASLASSRIVKNPKAKIKRKNPVPTTKRKKGKNTTPPVRRPARPVRHPPVIRKAKRKKKLKKCQKDEKSKKKRKAPSSEEKGDDRPRRKEVEIPPDNPKVAYAKLITTLHEALPDTSFDVDTCDHDEWVKTVKNSTGVTINVLNKQLAKHSLSQTTHTDKSGKVNQLIDFYVQ